MFVNNNNNNKSGAMDCYVQPWDKALVIVISGNSPHIFLEEI